MAGKNKKKKAPLNYAAQNRRARHDYFIEDTMEAGIVLTGTEVKSLRQGRASIGESYAAEEEGELYLLNAYIPEYTNAAVNNHEPRRKRKLLVHRREMARLFAAVNRQGMTLVPLSVYFNDRGMAKLELALARGKHKSDKRETSKTRDWERQKARLMRTR